MDAKGEGNGDGDGDVLVYASAEGWSLTDFSHALIAASLFSIPGQLGLGLSYACEKVEAEGRDVLR